MYGALIALALADIAQAAVMLVRPYWTTFNTWSRLVTHLATLVALCVLFRAGNWIVAVNGVKEQAYWDTIAANVNQALYYSFAVCLIVLPLFFAWDIYQRLRGKSAAPGRSSNCLLYTSPSPRDS